VTWGRLGGAIGAASALQQPDWESDVYPDRESSGLAVGLTGDFQATFFSPFGVLAHGSVGWFDAPVLDGRISAVWTWRGLTLGAGLGRTSLAVAEQVYDASGLEEPSLAHRSYLLQYGAGTAMVRSTRRDLGWDLGGTVGIGNATSLLEVAFGLVSPRVGRSRYRIGVAMDLRAARFVEQGVADRNLDAATGATHLTFEWVRGEY
jgi:hypothetical protein